jgi:hypothetical protein
MLHRVAFVRTKVSEDRIAFIIKASRIGEPGTTLPVTSNRSTQRNIPDDDILQLMYCPIEVPIFFSSI